MFDEPLVLSLFLNEVLSFLATLIWVKNKK